MSEKILPYGDNGDKSEEVRRMFDNISDRYDFLNGILSMGFGTRWRNRAVDRLLNGGFRPSRVLDVASGTGDFAIGLYRRMSWKSRITGIDISPLMLEKARRKAAGKEIEFMVADAMEIPFAEGEFDAVSCAYGIRNFDDPSRGLSEFFRVLSHGGRAVIVEISDPGKGPMKWCYEFYFNRILPVVGALVSGDAAAYRYLPESVSAFPHGADFVFMMEKAGFSSCSFEELFSGAATVYYAEKL